MTINSVNPIKSIKSIKSIKLTNLANLTNSANSANSYKTLKSTADEIELLFNSLSIDDNIKKTSIELVNKLINKSTLTNDIDIANELSNMTNQFKQIIISSKSTEVTESIEVAESIKTNQITETTKVEKIKQIETKFNEFFLLLTKRSRQRDVYNLYVPLSMPCIQSW